jgi:phenylacetate-CoA ligase
LRAVNFYGLSEMCGPGVAVECLEQRNGLHVMEDHFFVEVIDPDTGRTLEPGSFGELVFTTLTKEALPLIRYRTGDLGRVTAEPCPCGRTTVRLTDFGGRRDDMLIIRGVNIYPSSVEDVLLRVEGVAPYYQLIVTREGPLDQIALHCEPAEGGLDRMALAETIGGALREQTGLRIAVLVVDPGSVPRSEGKAVRVVDRRAG